MTLWNAGGICFSRTLGMLSGPGAFLPGSRRRASWKIDGVRLPMTMFLRARGFFCIALWQGRWISWIDSCVWRKSFGF